MKTITTKREAALLELSRKILKTIQGEKLFHCIHLLEAFDMIEDLTKSLDSIDKAQADIDVLKMKLKQEEEA